MTVLLTLGLLILLLAMGVPVAFSLLTSSLVYFIFVQGGALEVVTVQRLLTSLDSFPLLAVPLFVYTGSIMARGGLAEKLIGFADMLVGQFRGGLAQVNVLNSFFMGGMSGSASADAAIDSKVLVPVMTRRGYSLGFATAVTAASSSFSPLLPPSIALIVYGVLADVSIGDLFLAGIAPAIVLGLMMLLLVYIISRRRGYGGNRLPPKFREIVRAGKKAFLALMMPILLILGLRVGIFTPTELGAIAVAYALIVSVFAFRTLGWRDFVSITKESAHLTATIMLIIAAASVFGLVVTYEQIPALIASLVGPDSLNPAAFLIVIILLVLVAGMLLESLSLMIILVPVLAPIAMMQGIDPIHLGVLLVIAFTIGSLTPPVGTVVFTIQAITGVSLWEFTKEFLPFLMVFLMLLIIVLIFPALATWLPSAI